MSEIIEATGIDYRLETLDVEDIDIGQRFREDRGNIKPLAFDIMERGVISPISVLDKSKAGELEHHDEDGLDPDKPFLLLAGERRTRATLMAAEMGGWDKAEIPARIFDREMTEYEMRLVELHENILRKDMTDAEEMLLKKEVHELMQGLHGVADRSPGNEGHGVRQTAEMFGESHATTSRHLQLAEFIEGAKDDPELREQIENANSKTEIRKIKRDVEQKLALEELNRRRKQEIEEERKRSEEAEETAKEMKEGPAKRRERRQHELIERYRLANFFQGAEKIPDRSVDFVELDPDWGIDFDEKKKAEGSLDFTSDGYKTIQPEEYEENLRTILKECYRFMKDHSWMIVWYSLEYWHDTTIHVLEEEGFRVCGMPAIWYKRAGNTSTPAYRLGESFDAFLYARKGSPRIQQMGRNNDFRFRPLKKKERIHPAEKPIELYEEIIETFCGTSSVIVSPFVGSGNVILAADNLDHAAIGFDLSKKFKDRYDFRVLNGQPGEYKSYGYTGGGEE